MLIRQLRYSLIPTRCLYKHIVTISLSEALQILKWIDIVYVVEAVELGMKILLSNRRLPAGENWNNRVRFELRSEIGRTSVIIDACWSLLIRVS